MTRLRLPAGPRWVVPLAVAAVVVLALVGVGLFALGRDGGGAGGSSRSGNQAKGSGDRARAAPVRLTVSPRNGAAKVALDARARVVADSGRLLRVKVTGGDERLAGRLADDGRSWERTWKPVGEQTPRRVYGHTVVADDGSLNNNATDGKAYVSRDGGRTFSETEPRFGDYAYWIGTGYLAVDVESGREVDMSEDGLHWRKVKIG